MESASAFARRVAGLLAFISQIQQHGAALTTIDLQGMRGFDLSMNFALVGRTSLDVLALADEVLSSRCEGERLRLISEGDVQWQTAGPRHNLRVSPTGRFEDLPSAREFFLTQVKALTEAAGLVDGTLMATGMHPWFRAANVQPWPHGGAKNDKAVHALFNGARHGWANQNGLGLALPFSSEAEFSQLYKALRFLLPLVPVLSAASPLAEGASGPARQCRVGARHDFFCAHPEFAKTSVQRHVPPALESIAAHKSLVAEPLEAALRRHEYSDVLSAGDVYAGGLWPNTASEMLELRMLDGQECVSANIALCAALDALAREISFNSSVPTAELDVWPAARLNELTEQSVVHAEEAIVRDADYLRAWGFPEGTRCRMQELVQYLWEDKLESRFAEDLRPFMEVIVMKGPLASRIVRALPPRWDAEALFLVYRDVVGCLGADTSFPGESN